MAQPVKRLQPRSYHAFRCIGAACEDSCCTGWAVNVDKSTFETYQRCDDSELGPRLRELVTINPASTHDHNHARITLSGSNCSLLAEGWCAIQKKLGAQHLPIMCALFPRVMNAVEDVIERSLDLSCPEAARIVLLDPKPIEFDQEEGPAHDPRMGQLSWLSVSNETSGKPYRHFREIRGFAIWLLQNRAYPLWKRLVILGSFCDQLQAMATEASGYSQICDVLEAYRDATDRDLFGPALAGHQDKPAPPLETVLVEMVLELIVGRIGSDFTGPRFLGCYQEFMQGMQWTEKSTMEDLARRYRSELYTPFLRTHEHMLEHYLVSYVHRTLFPLGPQENNRELSAHHAAFSIRQHCLLLLVHDAILQTMLVGLAGLHQGNLDASHAIKLIQSFSKVFEHSLTFPERALQVLTDHGIRDCASLAMMLRN